MYGLCVGKIVWLIGCVGSYFYGGCDWFVVWVVSGVCCVCRCCGGCYCVSECGGFSGGVWDF